MQKYKCQFIFSEYDSRSRSRSRSHSRSQRSRSRSRSRTRLDSSLFLTLDYFSFFQGPIMSAADPTLDPVDQDLVLDPTLDPVDPVLDPEDPALDPVLDQILPYP